MKDRAAIVGVGYTPFTKDLPADVAEKMLSGNAARVYGI